MRVIQSFFKQIYVIQRWVPLRNSIVNNYALLLGLLAETECRSNCVHAAAVHLKLLEAVHREAALECPRSSCNSFYPRGCSLFISYFVCTLLGLFHVDENVLKKKSSMSLEKKTCGQSHP